MALSDRRLPALSQRSIADTSPSGMPFLAVDSPKALGLATRAETRGGGLRTTSSSPQDLFSASSIQAARARLRNRRRYVLQERLLASAAPCSTVCREPQFGRVGHPHTRTYWRGLPDQRRWRAREQGFEQLRVGAQPSQVRLPLRYRQLETTPLAILTAE